jgi:hypothetical protein
VAPQRLPVSATPLVGRARELVLLRQLLLDGDVRAVTITGPAGVGKTPLAMALLRCVDPGQAEGQPVGYGYCGMASELQICRLARGIVRPVLSTLRRPSWCCPDSPI